MTEEYKPQEYTPEQFLGEFHRSGPVLGMGAKSADNIPTAIRALAEGAQKHCDEQGLTDVQFALVICPIQEDE